MNSKFNTNTDLYRKAFLIWMAWIGTSLSAADTVDSLCWSKEWYTPERKSEFFREIVLPQGGPFFLVWKSSDLRFIKELDKQESSSMKKLIDLLDLGIECSCQIQISRLASHSDTLVIEGFTCIRNDEPFAPTIIESHHPHKRTHMNQIVEFIAELRNLRHLELYQFPLDQNMLAAVCNLNQLEYLGLPAGSTDEAIDCIKRLKNLRFLNASGTKITGKYFHYLADLPHLEILDLRGTSLDQGSLSGLEQLKSLKTLMLAYSNVTDGHLAKIRPPEKLHTVTLHQTAVTDNCVPYLVGIKDLKYLSLYDTAISEKGYANLETRSNLTVVRNAPLDASEYKWQDTRILAYQGHVKYQYLMAVFERENNPTMSLMWYYLCRDQAGVLSQIRQKKLPEEIETVEKQLTPSQIEWSQQNAAALRYVQLNSDFKNPITRDYNLPVYQIRFETITRSDISGPCNP